MVNVASFDRIEWVAEQEKYTPELAKKLLGAYIFPAIGYEELPYLLEGVAVTDSKQVKSRLVTWMLAHDKEQEEFVDGFNEDIFDKINRKAFDDLLKLPLDKFIKGIYEVKSEEEDITIKPEGDEEVTLEDAKKIGTRALKFLNELSDNVLDPEYFNTDITLSDIYNRTPKSKYFYQLTPTQVDDPLFQELLIALSEDEYTIRDIDRKEIGEQTMGAINAGEFASLFRQVLKRDRPVDIQRIQNGVKTIVADDVALSDALALFEGELSTSLDLLEGKVSQETEEGENLQFNLNKRQIDIILGLNIASAILNRKHPEETSMDFDFLYPCSILPGYERVERALNDFKRNYQRILKIENIEIADEQVLKDAFDFNTDFRNSQDTDRYEQAIVEVEFLIDNPDIDSDNLVSGDKVNRAVEKFLTKVILDLTGQMFTVQFSVGTAEKVNLGDKELSTRILAGNNPISRTKLANIIDKNVKDLKDVKTYVKKGTAKFEENRASIKTMVTLALPVLDLTKGSILPEAAKSQMKVLGASAAEKTINIVENVSENLSDYMVKKETKKKPNKQQIIYNLSLSVESSIDNLINELANVKLVQSKNPQDILDESEILDVIGLLSATIINTESIQDRAINNTPIGELIDEIENEFTDEDSLSFEDFTTRLKQVRDVATLVSSVMDPTQEKDEDFDDREVVTDKDEEDSLEVATTQGEDGETIEEDVSRTEQELDVLDIGDYEFIMSQLRPTENKSLVSIINLIEDDDTESKRQDYEEQRELVSEVDMKQKFNTKEGKQLASMMNDLVANAYSLENVNLSMLRGYRKRLRVARKNYVDKVEGIQTDDDRLANILKNTNMKNFIIDVITKQSGFNTVDIVDLDVKLDITFVQNKQDGPRAGSPDKIQAKVTFKYKNTKVIERTVGNIDFVVSEAVGRRGSARRVATIADRERVGKKGQIQDERKAKIYNEIYNNILQLDNLLKRVEAE